MTLITRAFETLFASLVRGRGMPDLPHVVLPYPLETLSEGKVLKIARDCWPQVLAALTSMPIETSS